MKTKFVVAQNIDEAFTELKQHRTYEEANLEAQMIGDISYSIFKLTVEEV